MSRLGFAALVLLAATAFAPAPFPRRARAPESDLSLKALQGTWRVVSVFSTKPNGRHVPETFNGTAVRIAKDRWTFLPDDYNGANLELAIDHSATPVRLTFYSVPAPKVRVPHGVGILRRRGDAVELLYTWGGEADRPKAFDPSPDAYYLMTLKRK